MKNFDSPLVGCRVTGPGTPIDRSKLREPTKGYKLNAKSKPSKYDHAQMLSDRIGGMSWEQVAAKHKVPGDAKTAGRLARSITLNSAAARHLKPNEAAKLDGIKDKK